MEASQWRPARHGVPGLLSLLDRAGEIELPPSRRPSQNRPEGWERPEPVVPDNTPVRGPLYELMPLEFQQLRHTPQEPLFNSLMEQYHYLRSEQPVGEHLKLLGMRTRASNRLSGLVVGGAASGEPRSFHRLERRSAEAQSAFARV